MNEKIPVVFLFNSIILLVLALSAYYSANSVTSFFFNAVFIERAFWLLISGLAAGMVGSLGLILKIVLPYSR
jgi:hypothetical protein